MMFLSVAETRMQKENFTHADEGVIAVIMTT